MGGRHDDRNSDLLPGNVGKNSAGAANLMYRLSPNVLLSLEASQVRTDYLGTGNRINNHYLSLEASQVRTDYLGTGNRINNHYDLAVAYLF
jgi:hypothetical protein